jgi:hypothetical protein
VRPQLDLPRELIVDRGNVAGAARIPVLQPGTANIMVLLVAYHLQLFHVLFGLLEEV